ncbi:MAG: HipA N-terminal domain-containing protein [Planctomycetota bacterium]
MSTAAEVRMWGRQIGAVDGPSETASFQYTDAFRRSGIEVVPLTMPLAPTIHRFPSLGAQMFRGLPGMLADTLPDAFSNAVIDVWLGAEGGARRTRARAGWARSTSPSG